MQFAMKCYFSITIQSLNSLLISIPRTIYLLYPFLDRKNKSQVRLFFISINMLSDNSSA